MYIHIYCSHNAEREPRGIRMCWSVCVPRDAICCSLLQFDAVCRSSSMYMTLFVAGIKMFTSCSQTRVREEGQLNTTYNDGGKG